MNSKLRVIVKEPGKDFEVREIVDDLSSFQKIVGGLIQYIPWFIDDLELVCYGNDEGKLDGLAPNFAYLYEGEIIDVMAGTAVFMRSDDEGGNLSVIDSDIGGLREELKKRTLIAPASMSNELYCEVLLSDKEVYFRWPVF